MSNEVTFGPFVLSVAQRRLWHAGLRVDLKPKEAELLAFLAERSPRAISKDELIERLWKGGEASDAALTQTVYRLRQTLCRYSPERDFIRTVPGLGFQFAGGSPIDVRSAELDFQRPSFTLYQQAAFHYRQRTEASILHTIVLLERALVEDPGYVPALVLLAKAYTTAGIRLFYEPRESYWRARRALEMALTRDPDAWEAYATLSTLLLFFNGNREQARSAAERALLMAPQSASAHNAAIWERLSRRDFDAALTQADLAVRSGPASQQSASLLGIALYMSRRFNDAHRSFETARSLDPTHAVAIFYDACAYTLTGAYDRADDLLDAMSGNDLRTRIIAVRGYIAAKRGDDAASSRAVTALACSSVPSHVSLAAVYLARGEIQRAGRMLERALETREPGLFLAAVDPMYAPLREASPDLIEAIAAGRPPRCDRCAARLNAPKMRDLHRCVLCDQCAALDFVETAAASL